MAPAAETKAKTADYEFSYAYPAAAARIAGLKAWLDADRSRIQAKAARDGPPVVATRSNRAFLITAIPSTRRGRS